MPKNWPGRPELTAERLRDLAAAARVDVDEKRATALMPQIQGVQALLDGLRQVDLGETPPSPAFSAQWED